MKKSKLRNLPPVMRSTAAWLVANKDKIPVQPCSSQRITGDKSKSTLSLEDVIDLIESDRHDHAVFFHSDQDTIASIDIDHCQNPQTHELFDWCAQFVQDNDIRYMESSSSGTGLRICCQVNGKTFGKRIYYINPQHYLQSPPKSAEKFEIMANQCLATYTGDIHYLCTDPSNMTDLEPVLQWLDQHYPIPSNDISPVSSSSFREHPETTREQIQDALSCISPDLNHDDWKQVGMALKDWCPVEGEGLWINWSSGSEQFKNDRECCVAWKSFDKTKSGITVATLFHKAKQGGYQPKQDDYQSNRSDSVIVHPTISTPDNLPPIPMMNGLDVMNMPVVPCLVDDLLPETGFAQIFGNSGAFKSFVALDLAMAVVSGSPWFGRAVKQGSVVYLCGEGVYGMGARLRAWSTKGIEADLRRLNMSAYMPDFTNFDVLGRIVNYLKSLPDLRLLVIDTFARAMIHIGNENDNSDIGEYNRIIDHIRNQLQCLILQVHHTGHTNKDRSRGGSGLYAALDAEYQCVKVGEKDGYLKCTKAKDFPEPDLVNFTMKTVMVNDASSMLVTDRVRPVPTTRQEAMEDKRSERLSEKQVAIINTYNSLYSLHENNANANDNVTPRVLLADLKDQLVDSGVCSRGHATRDINSLVKRKVLKKEGLYIKMD